MKQNPYRLATDIYGGAYESERGRQEAASRFAPDLAAEDYRDIDALSAVGSQREQQQQRLIDDLIARFEFGRDEPNIRLSRYASLLGNPVTESSGKTSSRDINILKFWG